MNHYGYPIDEADAKYMIAEVAALSIYPPVYLFLHVHLYAVYLYLNMSIYICPSIYVHLSGNWAGRPGDVDEPLRVPHRRRSRQVHDR